MVRIYKSERAQKRIRETYDALLALWGVPVRERDVATSFGQTHVVSCGSVSLPPLVLFHGVGDDSALMWIYNARALSESFCVTALDTMGGPGKSVPGAQYGPGFVTEKWIDETLDALGIEKAYIAGTSNGGYMAQRYAILRPERVIKAVCMAGGAFDGQNGSPMRAMLRVFLPEAMFPTKRNVSRLITKLSGEHSDVFTGNPAVMAHYESLLKGFRNAAMRYHPLTQFSQAQIETLQNRALFVIGGKDPLGSAQAVREKCERYGLTCRVFDDAGHGVNHEKADEVNRLIADYFLKT